MKLTINNENISLPEQENEQAVNQLIEKLYKAPAINTKVENIDYSKNITILQREYYISDDEEQFISTKDLGTCLQTIFEITPENNEKKYTIAYHFDSTRETKIADRLQLDKVKSIDIYIMGGNDKIDNDKVKTNLISFFHNLKKIENYSIAVNIKGQLLANHYSKLESSLPLYTATHILSIATLLFRYYFAEDLPTEILTLKIPICTNNISSRQNSEEVRKILLYFDQLSQEPEKSNKPFLFKNINNTTIPKNDLIKQITQLFQPQYFTETTKFFNLAYKKNQKNTVTAITFDKINKCVILTHHSTLNTLAEALRNLNLCDKAINDNAGYSLHIKNTEGYNLSSLSEKTKKFLIANAKKIKNIDENINKEIANFFNIKSETGQININFIISCLAQNAYLIDEIEKESKLKKRIENHLQYLNFFTGIAFQANNYNPGCEAFFSFKLQTCNKKYQQN